MTREMVAAYVETLLEQLTGNEKIVPDQDGDYPVRYRDARYFVRVVGKPDRPIILVFSVAVDGVEASPGLYEELNDINTKLHFSHCFRVRGQILFETEHLGMTIKPDDFQALVLDVAEASDYFAPQLVERFGGRLAFEDSKGEGYEEETPSAHDQHVLHGYLLMCSGLLRTLSPLGRTAEPPNRHRAWPILKSLPSPCAMLGG